MSGALMGQSDFRPARIPPSSLSPRSHSSGQSPIGPQGTTYTGGGTTLLFFSATPGLRMRYLSTELESGRPISMAALTEHPMQVKVDGFLNALNEAIVLAEELVLEKEGDPLNAQTVAYAAQALIPIIATIDLPPPLMLPLQGGGISAEWHISGMNIEMRFRRPFEVYVVVEDVRGVLSQFHGRDLNLAHARPALRMLSDRLNS